MTPPRANRGPEPLSRSRVLPTPAWKLLAGPALQSQRELARLVADPAAVVVDGRLVVALAPRGDPGGHEV
ncbi:MAG: hypothetical protein U0R52_11615 [Solirubrobacterales bacterium]